MEELKNEILGQLNGLLNNEQLMIVDQIIANTLRNYEIHKNVTDLVPYNIKVCPELDAFILRKQFRGLSERTITQYKYLLNAYVAWLDKDVKKANADDIRMFLDDYAKINDISNRTKDHKRLILCSFYKFLHLNGYIKINPTDSVEAIKYKQKAKEPLTHMEIELLRRACENDFEEALFETLYSTGCRIQEVVDIKLNDIDLEHEQIKVCGKGDKERYVLLTPRAQLAIKLYLKNRTFESDALFACQTGDHHAYGKCSLENCIKKLGIKAGIKVPVYPHLLRTTMASHLLESTSIDIVQELLGHTKIETTRIYAKTSKQKIKSEFKRACASF